MNVILTTRHEKNKYGAEIDVIESAYIHYLESFGLNIIPVSNRSNRIPKLFVDLNIKGIILSGGNDISSPLGKESNSSSVSIRRNELEVFLLEYAIEKRIPVFGICRGLQFINLFFGGKICHDIQAYSSFNFSHVPGKDHFIELTDSYLSKELNRTDFLINSFHNQGVLDNELARGIKMFARCKKSRIVEGLFVENYPIAAIQWHPERQNPSPNLDAFLFNSFLKRELYWKNIR